MKNRNRKKILYILHIPPPVHGAAMVGQYLHDSVLIHNSFNCRFINLSTSKDLNVIGKGSLIKLITLISVCLLTQIVNKYWGLREYIKKVPSILESKIMNP